MRFWALLIVPILVASPQPVLGQQKSGVMGTVVDYAGGTVVTNAKIIASKKGFTASVTSGSEGAYNLPLPPGTYYVVVEANGFKPLKRKNVKVETNAYFVFNINLTLGQLVTVDERHP